VPQVMKTQLWQACFLSDPEPNLGDGGVGQLLPSGVVLDQFRQTIAQ